MKYMHNINININILNMSVLYKYEYIEYITSWIAWYRNEVSIKNSSLNTSSHISTSVRECATNSTEVPLPVSSLKKGEKNEEKREKKKGEKNEEKRKKWRKERK